MRVISLLIFVVGLSLSIAFSQNVPEPVRYEYHLTGIVSDEYSAPMPGMFVCWNTAERPLNARFWCAKTDDKGMYDLTVLDTADKYLVIASNVNVERLHFDQGNSKHRVKDSGVLIFGPRDETRTVNIQFDAVKPATHPDNEVCSEISSIGLQLCTTVISISARSREGISLSYFIRNTTGSPIALKRNDASYKNEISVTNSHGEAVLTKCELLSKRIAEDAESMESYLRDCLPVYSGPSEDNFLPNQDTKGEISVSDNRDLSSKEIYFVYLTLTLSKNGGNGYESLPLGPIKLEIK